MLTLRVFVYKDNNARVPSGEVEGMTSNLLRTSSQVCGPLRVIRFTDDDGYVLIVVIITSSSESLI